MNTTNGKKDVGFIAQDVEQALEEIGYGHTDIVQVFDEEAGTLGLKYTSFISILTQAVKELDAALKKSQQAQQEQKTEFEKTIEEQNALIQGLLKRIETFKESPNTPTSCDSACNST